MIYIYVKTIFKNKYKMYIYFYFYFYLDFNQNYYLFRIVNYFNDWSYSCNSMSNVLILF